MKQRLKPIAIDYFDNVTEDGVPRLPPEDESRRMLAGFVRRVLEGRPKGSNRVVLQTRKHEGVHTSVPVYGNVGDGVDDVVKLIERMSPHLVRWFGSFYHRLGASSVVGEAEDRVFTNILSLGKSLDGKSEEHVLKAIVKNNPPIILALDESARRVALGALGFSQEQGEAFTARFRAMRAAEHRMRIQTDAVTGGVERFSRPEDTAPILENAQRMPDVGPVCEAVEGFVRDKSGLSKDAREVYSQVIDGTTVSFVAGFGRAQNALMDLDDKLGATDRKNRAQMDIQASIDVLLSSSPDQFTEKLSVVRQKALEFIPFADEVRRPGRYTTSVDLMKAVRRILAVRKKVFGEEADFDESDKSAANLLEDSKSFSLHDQHLCSLPRFIDRVLEFHQRNPELARACWTTVYPERGDATNYAADISLVDASMVREHVHADYPQVIYGVLSRNVDRPFIADYVGIFKFISPDRTEFMNAVTSQDYIDRLSGLPTETAKTYLGLFHAYMRKAGDRLITYDVFDPTKQEGRTVMRAVEETPHILDPLAGRGASSEDKELIVGYLQSLTVPEYLSALRAVAQKPYTNAYVDLFVMSAQKIKDADGYSEFKRVASSEGFVGFLDSVEQRAAGAASAYIGLLDDESTALTLMSNPLRTILTASPEAVGSLRTLRENKCLTAVLPHMVIEEYAGFFTGQRLSTLARWSTNANQWKAAEAALRYLRDGDRLRAGLVLSISDEHAGNVEQVGSILRTLNETPDQFLDGAEGGLTGINRARERHYRERGIPAERRERIINEALRVMNPQVVDAFKRLCAHAPKLMPSPSEGKGFAENFAKNWREVPADLTIQIINQLIEKARGTQQSG